MSQEKRKITDVDRKVARRVMEQTGEEITDESVERHCRKLFAMLYDDKWKLNFNGYPEDQKNPLFGLEIIPPNIEISSHLLDIANEVLIKVKSSSGQEGETMDLIASISRVVINDSQPDDGIAVIECISLSGEITKPFRSTLPSNSVDEILSYKTKEQMDEYMKEYHSYLV